MAVFYSKTTNGFYDPEIHGDKMPVDVVSITGEYHIELLTEQSNGKLVQSDEKGYPVAIDRPKPSNEKLMSLYKKAASANLDDVAKNWGYDSIVSAVSYINSSNAQFKADAEILSNWRDRVWEKIFDVQSDKIPSSVECFMALLPEAPSKPSI